MRIARVPAGESVGNGRTFYHGAGQPHHDAAIGYGTATRGLADQRARHVLIKGRPAVVGRVCMDMLMVDVTDIPGASLADGVTLLGADGGERITPDELRC